MGLIDGMSLKAEEWNFEMIDLKAAWRNRSIPTPSPVPVLRVGWEKERNRPWTGLQAK